MSRCFPFPPPGYEKKTRTDDVDLLKKEKNREKKQKKEKKNREKKEGKDREKKEKDRSDGKHRDKKEKKEKQRDKKEDRDTDKDKIIASNEKRLPGQSESNNGDKVSDEKRLPAKFEINSGEIFIQKGNGRDLGRSSISGEKKFAGQFSGYNERVSQNARPSVQPKELKFVQEVDKRIRDEAKGTGKQMVEKFTGADARKDEGMFRLVAKATGTSVDVKEKNKIGDDRKLGAQGIREVSRFTGNAMAQSLPGMVQPRIDKTPRSLENDVEKRVEGKEKSRQKEGDDRHGDKRRDKIKEKDGLGKDKNRDKERKKEEKLKGKSEYKNMGPDKLKESNKDGPTGIHNAKTSHLPRESSAVTEGNLKKRKDLDTNGFISANDIRPNKVSRLTPSHPSTENGRISGTLQTSSPLISGRQGPLNNLKADAKELKKNGIIEPQALSVSTTQPLPLSTTKSLPTTTQADKKAEPPKRPPHPDLKYLSQVLTVPKMEEWSDFDDQEWLFLGSDSQLKKPKLGSLRVDETPQVWSEALQIDSVDVCALPYVIPY
ncbi:hypothetical protein JCGZ_01090 [Jatropha curcas]|uniref:Uncharacterized protein n=1 Tax=Jatropha curcas TaxID=180498 RepID=A0A067KWI7_JATCU|nr:splicing regulatory glutamine/lysine-rich protein 1 [Jatropha curcas]XP_020534526.1 splicing regulatory glutamine/lysine-rich protein 1 [Jatropha curcas]XP_037492589.1 splicing regulatory glutamine/lysine-rich protein 1 [Jatropha curcas]KDP39333.1 hypothetical protein JCGZ_01090 [Jatropha curcas]